MPYRDPGTYRPPRRHIALLNRAVARLAALGLTPENTVCLEVPGRRSRRLRRTSLVVVELGGVPIPRVPSRGIGVGAQRARQWQSGFTAAAAIPSGEPGRGSGRGASAGAEGVPQQTRLLEVT